MPPPGNGQTRGQPESLIQTPYRLNFTNHNHVVTVLYDTHEQAEQAVNKVQHRGYDR